MDPLPNNHTLRKNLVVDAIITLFSILFDDVLESLVLVLILILFFAGAVVVKKLPHGLVLVAAGLSFMEILAGICFIAVVGLRIIIILIFLETIYFVI